MVPGDHDPPETGAPAGVVGLSAGQTTGEFEHGDVVELAAVAGEVRIPVRTDADVVTARKRGRELAAQAGFSATELTIIATAISEIARNIVMFANRGEILVSLVGENSREGVTVVARDAGPGIPDLEQALRDGYSGYGGMGLGLPGARRLMDEFEITSEVDKGTTVTMTKWRRDA
jgi:serine/threonine-protein kinase RsbT